MTQKRLARLRAELRRRKLDAFLVTSPSHIRYLTNFSGSSGCLLVHPRSAVLFTDSRYALQASAQTGRLTRCIISPGDPVHNAGRSLSKRNLRVGVEASHLSVSLLGALRSAASGVRFLPLTSVIESLTVAKDAGEIRRIRKAVSISVSVFREILGSLRPGISEVEIAAEISWLHRRKGAEGDAFDPIVASARRSALPHATPTRRKLRKGDILLLDFGCTFDGYVSDITRTVSIGKPSARFSRLYDAVHEARERALQLIRPGANVSAVDGAARRALDRHGLAGYFTHSLGHGLGLSVHENPRLAPLASGKLSPGNVITVEPGIYIPSVGGIRIEDDLVVTRTGFSLLSTADDHLVAV